MRLLLFFCLIVFISANKSEQEKPKCEGIHVHGKFHRKHVLARGLNRPYQLSIYKREHRIYFSVNVGKNEEDTFKIGYIEKDQTGHKMIDEVENGFASAVDEKKGIVYLGGSKGIYKHDLSKNDSKIEEIVSNHNIWDMFFKNELYFITYPMQHLYKYNTRKLGSKHEHQEHIKEEIYQFAIDGDNDTFITNDTGVYRIKSKTDDRILYEGAKVLRAIEINNKGEAYFCGKHAIYVANKTSHTLKEIAHIKNIFGITFDSEDNIVYSDPHEIVKLLPEDCK